MKTIYFDTNVYNSLLDENAASVPRLLALRKAKEVRFWFSVMNLEEFLHAAGGSHERTKKLSALARQLCTSQLLKSPADMVRDDLRSFLEGGCGHPRPYYTGPALRMNLAFWDKCVNGGSLSSLKAEHFSSLKERKRLFRDRSRVVKKRLEPMWEPYKRLPFKVFLEGKFKNAEFREVVNQVCIRYLGPRQGRKVFDKLDLSALPRLRFYLTHWVARIYRQLLKGEKPKWSDDFDAPHAFYAPCCDLFVTNDGDFLTTLRLADRINTEFVDFPTMARKFGIGV